MTIAKILVPLTGSKRDTAALRTAFTAARAFNAHVAVLFVHPDARESIPYVGVPLSPEVIQSLVDAAEEVASASSKSARATLATVADEMGARILAAAEKCGRTTATYHEVTGHFVGALEQAALLSDLVVFPPIAHGDNPEVHDGFARILMRSERPVLLSPDAGTAVIGRTIALGWDGGMAAAHALTAALPYLEKAEAVHVLCVRRSRHSTHELDDLNEYLTLHGVTAKTEVVDAGPKSVSDMLLEFAQRNGCDLLVMGGYGHNRALETMLGGVTQQVVSQANLPVLMMH